VKESLDRVHAGLGLMSLDVVSGDLVVALYPVRLSMAWEVGISCLCWYGLGVMVALIACYGSIQAGGLGRGAMLGRVKQ